jgi:hypothetical protein
MAAAEANNMEENSFVYTPECNTLVLSALKEDVLKTSLLPSISS